MLQCSFSAAHMQFLKADRIFRTGACGRPERKHSQIFDNPQHFSAYKLLFANILCEIHHFKSYYFSFVALMDVKKRKIVKSFRHSLFVMIRIP